MSKTANKQNGNHTLETKQEGISMIEKIMSVFAFLVLCVFPVVYHNYYFDILETKYHSYCAMAIGVMVAMLVYGLYTNKLIEGLRDFRLKGLIKSLNIADWSVLAFWLATVMSWMVCKWRWEAFWGTSGRYNGVFLISIYTIIYFLVTRFFVLKRVYLDAFLVISFFVCMFGISDYFQMDLLGFKKMMLDVQKGMYTSTFGNINTYTVYVGAVLCISMILYVMETCKKRMVFYFCVMAVTMVALIVGASDNAYLTLAALFGLSPLVLFRKKSWIRKYIASVALLMTAVVLVGWINTAYAEIVLGLDSIFVILSSLSFLPLATFALWGIVFGWAVLGKKENGSPKDELGKGLVFFWCAMIAVVVMAVVYVLYDANIAGNAEKYNAIKNYVVFNAEWGTRRGYVWTCSMELYNQVLDPIHKLFGYGADTFKLLMIQHYPIENNIVFDNAHNEYIHFLLTIGLFGMVSYIAILVSSIYVMVKRMADRPEVMAVMFVVIAYATQATVNLFLPVVFPLIWQLLAMGLAKTPEEK